MLTLQALHEIRRKLLVAGQGLDILLLKETDMVDPTITAVIKDIDDATNAIAARIQKLIDDAAAAGSLTAAEVVAALAPEVAKLKLMGANPAPPTP